jgi:hypothetical protein
MKSFFAVLVAAAIAGVVPQASAQVNLKVMMSGASGAWQAMALGTYKAGKCPTGSTGFCGHASFGKVGAVNNRFTLTDTRPTLNGLGGTAVTDTGDTWIVWNQPGGSADACATHACNVWAYVKVDSIVGTRCYFANPRCNVSAPSTFPTTPQALITVWGHPTAEQHVPAVIQAAFSGSLTVNAAVSEIRPEDALVGQCRINSDAGGGGDGLNGLGLDNPSPDNNAAGTCPGSSSTLGQLESPALVSSQTGSKAHPMAFNISGSDPFTGNGVVGYTTVQVGAYPLVFLTHRAGNLANVKDATIPQLQALFSGATCNANSLAGGGAGTINVFVREPLSGTMNTAEYSAFRLPRNSSGTHDGLSQETGLAGLFTVDPTTVGSGCRWGVVGNGEEVNAVNGVTGTPAGDSIGYAFFSYGNVAQIGNQSNFGYLTVDGVDPIWSVYGSTYDPGEPSTPGNLPNSTSNLVQAGCTAGAFPCGEAKLWKGKLSFPNLRSGAYRQWAMIRLYADTASAALTNAKALVASAQASAVSTVPDFVPAVAVTGTTDPGLVLIHSHYTGFNSIAITPNNVTDLGSEVGGCIVNKNSVATSLVQRNYGCAVGP